MAEIRETNEGDYKPIRALLFDAGMLGDYFSQERFSRMLNRNKGLYLVAVDGGRIVGSIFASHDGGYYAYVYKLAVDAAMRRQRIGETLVERILDKLKKEDIAWVYAHVMKDNLASLELLKKYGFHIRETHHLIDNGD